MGRKKSMARQKKINVQTKIPNDKQRSKTIVSTPKVTYTAAINKKEFPKLPISSHSMQDLRPMDAESFLTSSREVTSCDNLPLTSTLTLFSSSLERRQSEADALLMDKCCPLRLDDIVFKDSVPCPGERLQDDMAKILNSLHPKTASSFRSKIHDLSHAIDDSISKYNSVCRRADVRIDMLTSIESLLTEKVCRQRSKIADLEDMVKRQIRMREYIKLLALNRNEKQFTKLTQMRNKIKSLQEEATILRKDELTIKQLEEEVNILRNNKFIIKQLEEEVKILKENKFSNQSSVSEKSVLVEKMSRKRQLQIKQLKNEVEKLSDLIEETDACGSGKYENQHSELCEKDKIIESLEEIKISKKYKFREQSCVLYGEGNKVIPVEDVNNLMVIRSSKVCLEESNKTIQHLENEICLKLDSEETSESQQNLEVEVCGTSCENFIPEQNFESETGINEFDKILDLGKCLDKNLIADQKAEEMRSLQNEANCLKVPIGDQKVSQQEMLEVLNSLKSEIALAMEQLKDAIKQITSLDTELLPLRNEILVKSNEIQQLKKTIEDLNADHEKSNKLILSLQKENKLLKQHLAQLLDIVQLIDKEQKINLDKSNETHQSIQETKNFLAPHFFR